MAAAGIRACVAPSFRDAPWHTKDGHLLEYDWSDPERGPKGFEVAKRTIDLANKHPSGRLVVENGKCLTIDLDAELTALEAAQQRSMERVPEIDFANRTADEMAPMIYDVH